MQTMQVIHQVMREPIFVLSGKCSLPNASDCRLLVPNEDKIRYYPICNDFGPMNMASVLRFIEQLSRELDDHPDASFFYAVEGKRAMTNAVFLLGAFLHIKLEHSVEDVIEAFNWATGEEVEAYRDASFSAPSFGLTLEDCWRGLARAISKQWVQMPEGEMDYLWGDIDIDEYEHYDNPINGDVHEVVPGRFVALKGPKDLGGLEYRDSVDGLRDFCPEFYLEILKGMGVTDVVRLNESLYDGSVFESAGLRFHDLEFPDCTAPPEAVVEEFMRIADCARGSVAVHCKAGLGRTGTLIGVWLMRREGFSAREAMGWLRIMRPGSVIGEQQHYLVSKQPTPASLSDLVADSQYLVPPVDQAAEFEEGLRRREAARKAFPLYAGPSQLAPEGVAAPRVPAADLGSGRAVEISAAPAMGGAGIADCRRLPSSDAIPAGKPRLPDVQGH